jgi:type IV pilus assembly protein PilC
MGAGVAVLEAIRVTAHAVGNVVYEQALLDAGEAVKNGDQLSAVIEANPLFPAIVSQMLAVGEETGQTDKVLVKVADFYEEEVDVAIEGLSSIIEPVMIVIMGSMVGLIAASVMGPIAGLAQNIKG